MVTLCMPVMAEDYGTQMGHSRLVNTEKYKFPYYRNIFLAVIFTSRQVQVLTFIMFSNMHTSKFNLLG